MFDNLVPPNMDVVCNDVSTSTLSTVLGVSTTNVQDTKTCSNPIYYYLGYTFDVFYVVMACVVIYKGICYIK